MNNTQPVEKRFSKVNGKVCQLKVKVFSAGSEARLLSEVDENPVKVFSVEGEGSTKLFTDKKVEAQKNYSISTIKERLRYSKFSIRQLFRRTIIDYKKFWESQGSRLSDEDKKLVRGLFISDMMNIMNRITPEVTKGKQINTLLGTSAFGKELRTAAQKLQMPYRLAFKEEERMGAPTKKRYQDIQAAYNEFMRALLNYVFPNSENSIGLSESMGTVQANDDLASMRITE